MWPWPPTPTRAPAPGSLKLVQDFVNTLDVEEGQDLLSDGDGSGRVAARAGAARRRRAARPPPTPPSARALREALRALLRANAGGDPDPAATVLVNGLAARAPLRLELDAGGGAALHEAGRAGRRRGPCPHPGCGLHRDRSTAPGRGSRPASTPTASGPSTIAPAIARATGATWRPAGAATRCAPIARGGILRVSRQGGRDADERPPAGDPVRTSDQQLHLPRRRRRRPVRADRPDRRHGRAVGIRLGLGHGPPATRSRSSASARNRCSRRTRCSARSPPARRGRSSARWSRASPTATRRCSRRW